jgi:cytidylate kinase
MMNKTSPIIITISRQLGSGGAYIGQQLAKELNIAYVDREIICETAKQLSILEEDLENRDEKKVSFWQSYMNSYCPPDAYIPPQFYVPTDRELFKAEAEVIQNVAKQGAAVIIGRCGSYILREYPNHISVFLHGSTGFRKERIKQIYKMSDEDACKMITQCDKQRAQYYRKITGKEWEDGRQYSLSIDTSKIGIDNSIELIRKYTSYFI